MPALTRWLKAKTTRHTDLEMKCFDQPRRQILSEKVDNTCFGFQHQ